MAGRRVTDTDISTWTVTIPAQGWLTANKDLHYQQRSRIVRAWRETVTAVCRGSRLPKGVTPVTVHALVLYTSRTSPVRDRLNLAPTIKACVDGLTPTVTKRRKGRDVVSVGYGLLPDDSDRHVLDTTWELQRMDAATRERRMVGYLGEVVLTITEVRS